MAHQGRYILQNPSKYIGDPDRIFYRSSWEKGFLAFLDFHPKVTRFSSEEIIIPYVSPLDNKVHRYFPDFWVEFQSGRKTIIEIKPYSQSVEPKLPKKGAKASKLKVYESALQTYLVNQAKWQAADQFCKKNGLVFEVFTEKELATLGFKFL